LVIKTSGGDRHPAQLAALRDAAVGRNIMLIDRAMTDDQTLALIQLCDCYASLHRSEGYGLAMAEAMLLGKPVIATGYSGNLAFMHADNSCLVNYRLVRLERDVGEYHAGIRWAEPSIDHAADMMRSVRDNPAWRAELGSRAQADVRERLSIELAGRRMVERLAQIERASLELSCQDDPPR
jgi:glycosyltransferase involved in cell wall biosynthesis